MAEHAHHVQHVKDDPAVVAEHERTFESFIRLFVYIFGVSALILIFLAIFNS